MVKEKVGLIYKLVINKDYRFITLAAKGFYNFLSDEKYLGRKFKALMKKELNIINPKTFNEKIQWLKLHDRNPYYVKMVDKYEVKNYVAEKIGQEHIIPTFGVWDDFDDINFENLPDQFVLKCTHDSGGIVICKDKSNFNIDDARKKINKCLANKFFYFNREWPYKNVKPRIIAEKFMVDESGTELKDYKFFCFHGKPEYLFVATDRPYDTKFDFYDLEFNHLPIKNGHPNANKIISKPKGFDEMIELSKKLSEGIPHVRVDFYDINGQVYFGELTFYHFSGMVPFEPEEWDYKFGELININKL